MREVVSDEAEEGGAVVAAAAVFAQLAKKKFLLVKLEVHFQRVHAQTTTWSAELYSWPP